MVMCMIVVIIKWYTACMCGVVDGGMGSFSFMYMQVCVYVYTVHVVEDHPLTLCQPTTALIPQSPISSYEVLLNRKLTMQIQLLKQ